MCAPGVGLPGKSMEGTQKEHIRRNTCVRTLAERRVVLHIHIYIMPPDRLRDRRLKIKK